jgi:glc operon protein GlcG
MDHFKALDLARFVMEEAPRPVSVFIADDHGELIAAATDEAAAADTRLNAQRKAYTAARGDLLSTRAVAARALGNPAFFESHDPFFTFFGGGIAILDDGRRVGAIGVSGLTEEEDEALAARAVAAAGLQAPAGLG